MAAAFSGWAAVPALSPKLGDPAGILLVLAAADGRVLHASPAARPLAAALGASGSAPLAAQIARAGLGETGARLVRLHVDPRRIAPPALCLLSRGTREGGEPVVLLVPVGPMMLPRPRAGGQDGPSASPPAPARTASAAPLEPHEAATLRVGDRFLWRSDAAGILTALTGAGGGLARFVGQSWRNLAESGGLGGADAVLAALDARRTFRAAPASLDLGAGLVDVELSGAPLGRGETAFSGFGVVRSVPDAVADHPTEIVEMLSGVDDDHGPLIGALPPAGEAAPEEPASQSPVPASVGAAAVQGPAETALSVDEHAAFREIARALGVRYAGDDETAAPDPSATRPAGGAVMPFPFPQPEPTGSPAREAELGRDGTLLDALPVPALVLSGDTILAANRPLLALAGFPDLGALRTSGIGHLFRGLPPEDGDDGRRTVIETASGQARAVEVMRGACTWDGEPASCLILRSLDEDIAPALEAERLARQVQAARAVGAEAALDALDTGVVTIDGAGRVVALNRAATALFGGDPREVVGGSFAGLFDAASAVSVAQALRGIGEDPRAVTTGGRSVTLALASPRADGHRVAVLARTPGSGLEEGADESPAVPPTPPADGRRALLSRLDRHLRMPTTDIVEMAGAMLREPHGPLGDPRYRDRLADIKDTGERMLERVTELLDLAAIEAGELDLHPRPLALNELVAGCVAQLQSEAARGRIVLRTSFSSDLAVLEADERSVSRAACLVIEHAIRRAAAGGQVIVSTGSGESAEIALRVRDTGAPRREASAYRSAEDGLGLALPRALVEANGGRLRLSGRADEGTLVEIILPARHAAQA